MSLNSWHFLAVTPDINLSYDSPGHMKTRALLKEQMGHYPTQRKKERKERWPQKHISPEASQKGICTELIEESIWL